MIYRKAEIKDLNEIIALLFESFSHAWEKTNRKIDVEFVKENFRKSIENDISFVVEENNELVGFGSGRKKKDFFGNTFGDVSLLLVRSDCQNKEIGSTLIKKIEKELKEKDLRLTVLSNNPAKELYKRTGYKDFQNVYRK